MADYTNHTDATVAVMKRIFGFFDGGGKKKKKKPTVTPNTFRNVTTQTKVTPKEQTKNTQIFVKELKSKQGPAAAAIAGIVGGAFSANNKQMAPEALKVIQAKQKLKTALNIGKVVGTGAQFAVPYGVAGKAIESLPKIVEAGNVVGKLLTKTPLAEKTAMSLGGKLAKFTATEAAVGVPLNTNYALNSEGLKGSDAVKNIAGNTAIDVATGGLMEVAPALISAVKKLRGNQAKAIVDEVAPQISKQVEAVKTTPIAEPTPQVTPQVTTQVEAPVAPKVTAVTPEVKAVEPTTPKPITAKDLKVNTGEFKVKTPEGTQVPKFNNTAYPYMTEDVKAAVQSQLEQGKYLFTNNTLQRLQAQSAKKLETSSLDEVNNMSKTFMASNDLSPQAQADGLNLALYYQGLGDTVKATEIGMATAERFSQIGSALNTAKLIQKFTPEGRQQMVFNIMNKLQNANSKSLKGQKLTINPETLKAVVDAIDETAKRILSKVDGSFTIDEQGLIRFKGLVYIPN